jgi:hypothetical protein
MTSRRLLLAGLAGALLIAALFAWRPWGRLFPELAPEAALRIELARGRDQLVLGRPGPTAGWSLLSAEDMPGDPARVEAFLGELDRLGVGAEVPAPGTPPTDLRVTGADGAVLAEARLWPGTIALPPGWKPRAAPELSPPDLSPWRWSTVRPPALRAGDVAAAWRITPGGAVPLSPPERATLAAALAALPGEWTPARRRNWAGASYFQLRLADGRLVEVQLTPPADGPAHVRLNAPASADIARLKGLAFRAPGLDGMTDRD